MGFNSGFKGLKIKRNKERKKKIKKDREIEIVSVKAAL